MLRSALTARQHSVRVFAVGKQCCEQHERRVPSRRPHAAHSSVTPCDSQQTNSPGRKALQGVCFFLPIARPSLSRSNSGGVGTANYLAQRAHIHTRAHVHGPSCLYVYTYMVHSCVHTRRNAPLNHPNLLNAAYARRPNGTATPLYLVCVDAASQRGVRGEG